MKKVIISIFLILSNLVINATNYYVAKTGSNSNDGLSTSTPFLTVTYANSIGRTAGDTIFIKAGLYQNENFMVGGTGTANAHIVFQGYYQIPGDTPNPNYNPFLRINDSINWNLIPMIQGANGSADVIDAFTPYVDFKNIAIKGAVFGIWVWNTHHVTFENVHTTTNGFVNSDGVGLYIHGSYNCTIRNCTVTDAGMVNLIVRQSHDCLVENTKSFAVGWVYESSDYHINLQDVQNTTIRNCQAYNLHPYTYGAPGHGIGIKDEYKNGSYPNPHSTGDSIINCTAYDMGEYFYVAHESYGNVFLNCTAISTIDAPGGWSQGIDIRDGAYNNKFDNITVLRPLNAITIQNTIEGPEGVQTCSGNVISNSLFVGAASGIEIWNANNNVIKNCVFDSIGSGRFIWFPYEMTDVGNVITNSIISNCSNSYGYEVRGYPTSGTFSNTYSDFYNNSFSIPTGTGNISSNPQFVNTVTLDYHLKSTAGHWNGTGWTLDLVTSPCIDTGNPSDDYSLEPTPNGSRINMGLYGNTLYASKTSGSSPSIQDTTFSVSQKISYSSVNVKHINSTIYEKNGNKIIITITENKQTRVRNIFWQILNIENQEIDSKTYTETMDSNNFSKLCKIKVKK
jgi:parallel beta-helix repeat protein